MDVCFTRYGGSSHKYAVCVTDCGGQSEYMEGYLRDKKRVFGDVIVMVYVFDIEPIKHHVCLCNQMLRDDLSYFQTALQAVVEESPNVTVFSLINKMDTILVPGQSKESYQLERQNVSDIRACDSVSS